MLMITPLEILAINESKLDDSFTDGEISIPGYTIVRKDRNRHGGGGGGGGLLCILETICLLQSEMILCLCNWK